MKSALARPLTRNVLKARNATPASAQIESGDFSAIGVHIAGPPSPTHLNQLRYASRFPYGILDAAMKAILSKMGRSAPDTARAR